MPLPFDATLKDLVQSRPADWLTTLGLPAQGPIELLNVDLSMLSAQADCVLGVGAPHAWALHLEFQSSRADELARRILMYNAILHRRLNIPICSAVVLLRPAASHPGITGCLQYAGPGNCGSLNFKCETVRVWEQPAEQYLQGSLGVAPLAPLGKLPKGVKLAAIIERLAERISKEASPTEAAKLFTAAYVLTGMRVSKNEVLELFRGVRAMRESTAYQAILDEGRLEGTLNTIVRLGARKLGKPTPIVEAALRAITDLERLERISDRMFDVATWQDLLATP